MDGICVGSGGNSVSICRCLINCFLTLCRIDVQDRVRRLGAHPDEDDLRLVERKRQMLSAMMIKLKRLQDLAKITAKLSSIEPADEDDEGCFDEITVSSDDPDAGGQQTGPDFSVVERQVLTMPSNGNVNEDVTAQEIQERVKQARRQISRLRDLIAEISFQYSHVVRNAPRKSNRTAAQKRIKALHNDLSYHARIYARCRSRLMTLHCEESLLRVFRVLTREDLRASTEILRPNEQGSSSVKLSWIWRTGRYFLFHPNGGSEAGAGLNADRRAETIRNIDANDDAEADPATLLECMCHFAILVMCVDVLRSQTCSLVAGPGSPPKMA